MRVPNVVVGQLVCILFCLSAAGSPVAAVYTYTGNTYDELYNPTPSTSTPYTSQERIVLSFGLAAPLLPGTEYVFNIPGYVSNLSIISWEVSDGIFSFGSSDKTLHPTIEGLVATDLGGRIWAWDISTYVNASSADGMEALNETTCNTNGCLYDIFTTSLPQDYASNNVNPWINYSAAASDIPGTWTRGVSPEPSSFSIALGGAMLLLITRAKLFNRARPGTATFNNSH
jgi:hypothetical protein